jgi:TetR/AcrR family transcriptional repressor of nem operon
MAYFEAAGFISGCLTANLGGELEGNDICRKTLANAFQGWRDSVAETLRQAQQLGQVRTDIEADNLADLLTGSNQKDWFEWNTYIS